MRIPLIIFLLFGLCGLAQANWSNDTIENPFVDMSVNTLSVTDGFSDSLTLTCSIFGSSERTKSSIAINYGSGFSNGATLSMSFKVDTKPTLSLDISEGLDSSINKNHQTAIYLADTPGQTEILLTLIDQFIAGYSVRTEVAKTDGTKRRNVFSLIGFTKAYREHQKRCGQEVITTAAG